MAKQKAKREAFVVENSEGPVRASLSNEWATALAATVRGCVVRYVPEPEPEPAAESWWGIVTAAGTLRVVVLRKSHAQALKFPGDRVISVRVVPVEPVKRAKAKATKRGGAK